MKESNKKQEDKLVEIVRNDDKLENSLRFEYIQLAQAFVEDFKTNLVLTSIDLDEKYPYGVDVWQGFLGHPPVKKYINTFVNEMISRNTDMALATGVGVRDAIGVKKAMAEANGEAKNENFIVFRLPDKEEDYVFTGEVS